MAEGASPRKLASIVAIDVAGYSRRTEADEEAAVQAIAALRKQVAKAAAAHGGRVFNTAGDGFMLEFPSASSALAAAEEISAAGDPPVRAGVHLGDVSVTEGGDLLGHGVNVAARIQQMASPGAVLVSGDVKRAIRGPLADRLKPQGSVRLDKMSETLPVFALAPAEGGRAKGRRRDPRLPAAAAAVLVLALAGVGLWLARGSLPWAQARPVRVAFAPFVVDSNDASLRQLADVMTDKTVEVLTANQVQTMLSRTADVGGPGRQGSNATDASFILGGSIRRDGETLRVSAHVDDAREKIVLWSGELTTPSGRASTFQLQAAARLAAVLKCAASMRRDGLAPGDTETLSLFLRICDWDPLLSDPGQMEQGLALIRQVVARAPGFSSAHSNLAFTAAFVSDFFPPNRREELRLEARTEAEKALALNSRNADALVTLAMLLPPEQRTRREALLSHAVSADPMSEQANLRYGGLLSEVGRLQDALAYVQKAAALAPLDPSVDAEAALAQARAGRQDGADATLKAVLLDWPDAVGSIGSQFYLARWEGRFHIALSMLQRDGKLNSELDPADRKTWREVLAALASRDPGRMAQQREAQIAFGGRSSINLSFSVENLSQLGLIDDAFAQAGKLGGIEVPINSAVLFNPSTAAMRREPRFMALAAKLGLVDYWRSTGKWPDFCAEPGLLYDCKAEAAKARSSPAK